MRRFHSKSTNLTNFRHKTCICQNKAVILRAKFLSMKDIEVSIKDFRAVNNAEIALNGITIISGVNSSGKSTISRLLYYTFKYANEFERVVDEYYSEIIEPLTNLASRIALELRQGENDELKKLYRRLRTSGVRIQKYETLISIFQKGKDVLLSSDTSYIKQIQPRYVQIIKNILDIEEENDLGILFDKVIILVQQISEDVVVANEERNYRYFKKSLEEKIGNSLDNINITEYGLPLLGKQVKNVPVMEYIQQVAYIDTPVIVGLEDDFIPIDYWDDLDSILHRPAKSKANIDYVHISENIRGEAVYDEEAPIDSSFKYKRNDGKVFDLFNSATGIKSFSVIQMLLNNGFINKNSLIIIDEPEAHLHPQWIVEYARMVVLLHKHIGAKFFIASHSTDFVSAIKYIATKEECLSSLSYYLSEEDIEHPFTYNYRSLGQDIEPIFESFNKSFELIDKYGADND